MDIETNSSFQSDNFYIISDINHKLQASPLIRSWNHVKGHQENLILPLDIWDSLNIICDSEAKGKWKIDQGNRQNHRRQQKNQDKI